MPRLTHALLAATLLTGVGGGLAWAQNASTASTYDPAQLPEVKGKVAQYTLSPRGDIDGLILADGTEIYVSPNLSTQIAFAVHPGDAVTIHGLKARATPMVLAASITNDASGATITRMSERGPRARSELEATGKVKEVLHEARGEANGVLLDDGTVVRLPPAEAKRLADQLAVGQTVVARGDGVSSPLGKVVMARQIGPDASKLAEVMAPHMRGGPWPRGRMEHGRPGAPPPPPAPAAN